MGPRYQLIRTGTFYECADGSPEVLIEYQVVTIDGRVLND